LPVSGETGRARKPGGGGIGFPVIGDTAPRFDAGDASVCPTRAARPLPACAGEAARAAAAEGASAATCPWPFAGEVAVGATGGDGTLGARTPGGAVAAAAGARVGACGEAPVSVAETLVAAGTGAGALTITPGGGVPTGAGADVPTVAGRDLNAVLGTGTGGLDGVGVAASSGAWARFNPSRSAFRRTLSAWASSMLEEWLVTPIPIDRHSSRPSLLVKPSSRASSYTRIFFDKLFFGPFLRLPRRPCPGHRLYLACSILACPEALANSAPTSAASTSWRKARLKARRLAALAIHSGRAMSGTPDRHSQAPRPGAPLSTTSRPSWLSATLSIVPASALARHPMQVRTGAAV